MGPRHLKRAGLAALLAVAATMAGCRTAEPEIVNAVPVHETRAREDVTRLRLLHTGDWHGYAFAEDRGQGLQGGVVAAAARVDDIRKAAPGRTIVLDAGDLLSGPPVVGLRDDAGTKGAPFTDFWQQVGWDAVALGNHEFDHGRANLDRLLSGMEPPVLCANIIPVPPGGDGVPMKAEDGTGIPGTVPYVVLERAGLKVAVVGVITSSLSGIVGDKHLRGVRVQHPATALARVMPELEATTDLQVVLSHCGVEEDREIAQRVPGIEAILGGHSHTTMAQPEVVNGVPICHAGPHGRRLGRLDLFVAGAGQQTRVERWDWTLLDMPRDPGAEQLVPEALLAQEAALRHRVVALEREVVGAVAEKLDRSYFADSPMGGAVCEALRTAAGADVAFVNSGGIRSGFGPGDVTMADVITAFPFGNPGATFTVTGAQLRDIVLHNVKASVRESYGVLQAAGYTCRYTAGADREPALASLTVGGAPLDVAATYTVATNTYVCVSHAGKYLGHIPEQVTEIGFPVRDAVEKALRAGTFAPLSQGRHVDVTAASAVGAPQGASDRDR
jgi:2',3'-cyclic-nucleotide 2'-phosphodiesterase (5'-nucleotidase family)